MSHPSDNLYSAGDDFDQESLSDELSPTDGYFNRSGRQSNSMVQDPSIDQKVEDKTLIPPPNAQPGAGRSSMSSNHPLLSRSPPSQSYASHHAASSNSSPSPSSYTPVSPVSPRRNEESFSEHSALLHGPPPAYTPSPVSPTTPHESIDRSYSTFPEHRLEAQVGFPPPREPESMGAPVHEPTERTPLAAGPLKTTKKRKLMHFAVAALVFVLIVVLMTTTFSHDKSRDAPEVPPQLPVGDGPKNRPVDHTGSYCSAATIKEDEVTYEFPTGTDLAVLQTTYGADDSRGLVNVNTVGEVRLRRLPKDSEHGTRAYFTVDTHISDPSLEVMKTWDEHSKILKISTPRVARLNTRGPHCVSLQITAWFPEDAEFGNLLFEALTLTLRVLDDIKINVSGQSKFVTLSGDISFPSIKPNSTTKQAESTDIQNQAEGWRSSGPEYPFSSRRILIETMSGDIDGNYPLMDYLGIDSQSGDINVDVIPQPVLATAPKPADLEVQTSSGTIKVNSALGFDGSGSQPPPRNYITNVHSSSGSIMGSFYLGSTSNFKSTSGSILLTGLPVLQYDGSDDVSAAPRNKFETHTISGGTDVQVLNPIFITLLSNIHENPVEPPVGDNDPYLIIPPSNIAPLGQSLFAIDTRADVKDLKLRSLKSTHASNSALVNVRYPEVWEGTMHAKTVSGNIEAKGKGIRIIKERNRIAHKEVVARKGVEEEGQGCLVEMQDIAGSLHFSVGLQRT